MQLYLTRSRKFLAIVSTVTAVWATVCASSFGITGNELLMGSLKASDMNKGTIDCMSLYDAVTVAVQKDQDKAPEIVASALPKTRNLACQKSLVMAAVKALSSDQRTLVPEIVVAAIKAGGNCGGNGKDLLDGKEMRDGKSGDSSHVGCQCAAAFASAALRALGPAIDQYTVSEVVRSASEAVGGACASQIADAATNAAPEFADVIADVAARAGNGDFVATESKVSFGITQRPIPAPFVTTPSLSGTIAPGEVTPVN